MPTVLINGVSHTLPGTPTIAEAVAMLGLTGKRIAVECNGEIVPRSQHGARALQAGDRVEIVTAVGGG